eukprot:GHVL01003487.1.p1 GENE.GHVL01003487.1~~GHVL01003487.1.p1  ORF type:complete len:399 (+),score=69.71 GHVL01003487.1:85-1281(+)
MDVDSSSKFIGSLTKFLQSLCNGYVEFQRGVELVGHIYLSIDTGEKVDYILHEKVSKNDENSVTFVSNSFHAQPHDIKEKEKEKASASKNTDAKSGAGASGLVDTSDDDDIMIVDQTKGVPGSTNSGTIPSRGTKRVASPSPDQRQAQRNRNIGAPSLSRSPGSNNPLLSPTRNLDSRQQLGGPSATITSRDAAQENLNMADVKLEQISRDELLSLATQVGEGGSGPSQSTSSAPRPQQQRSGASAGGSGDAASWIKQEAADDNGGGDSDTGWSQGRDDSNSNSGSNLYPVMLHQNPAAYSNPVFPGFSGSNTSSANPYANPVPGTSQDMGGLDPSANFSTQAYQQRGQATQGSQRWEVFNPAASYTQLSPAALGMRRLRQRIKDNPQQYALYKQRQK